MPFLPVKIPIDEDKVAATLKLVLTEIEKQNKVCTVLTKSEIKDLGTTNAKVILTFDLDKCVEAPPTPKKAATQKGKGPTSANKPAR